MREMSNSNKGQAIIEILIAFPLVFVLIFYGVYIMLALQTKLWLKHFAYEYAICVHYEKPGCKQDNIYIIDKLFPYLDNIRSHVIKGSDKTTAEITADFFHSVSWPLVGSTPIPVIRKLTEKGVFNE